MLGWVWWPPLFIPALTSRSGGFCESEASLVYRPAKDIKQWNHISKQKSTTKNKNQPSAVAGRMPLIPAFGRQRQADFWVRGQPGLQSDSQGYTEKPCLEKPKKKKKRKKRKKMLSFIRVDLTKTPPMPITPMIVGRYRQIPGTHWLASQPSWNSAASGSLRDTISGKRWNVCL